MSDLAVGGKLTKLQTPDDPMFSLQLTSVEYKLAEVTVSDMTVDRPTLHTLVHRMLRCYLVQDGPEILLTGLIDRCNTLVIIG